MRAIPSVERVADVELRRILAAFKEAIEVLGGARGTIYDRALLVSDLNNIGVIRVHNDKIIYNPDGVQTASFSSSSAPQTYTVISGSFEAIDPATSTTKTFTIVDGRITGMA